MTWVSPDFFPPRIQVGGQSKPLPYEQQKREADLRVREIAVDIIKEVGTNRWNNSNYLIFQVTQVPCESNIKTLLLMSMKSIRLCLDSDRRNLGLAAN